MVKAATHQIPPITFAFIRFSLAAGLLLVVLRVREGRAVMPWRELRPILALGAVGFGMYQTLWATALQSIPAGTSAFLIAATPVFTALVAVLAGSDVLTRPKLAGSLVSFAGVALVVAFGEGVELGSSLAGDVLTLIAAACWAVYVSYGAPVLRRHTPLQTTAWAMAGGSLVLLIPGIFQATGADWSRVEPAAWGGLLYSALIPAGVSNVVVFHAIRLLGPTRITALQFLVPFVAVVIAFVVLAEPIQTEQLIGGAVIVAGVAITRIGSRAASLVDRIRILLPEE